MIKLMRGTSLFPLLIYYFFKNAFPRESLGTIIATSFSYQLLFITLIYHQLKKMYKNKKLYFSPLCKTQNKCQLWKFIV